MLSLILPRLVNLPLSLQFLNASAFAPESKDEDLHAGVLQLPKGTVLLATESGVSEGQLVGKGMHSLVAPLRMSWVTGPAGVANLQAFQDVMSTQTLAYDFPFSRFSFPTDINCVIITEGKKSTFFKVGP